MTENELLEILKEDLDAGLESTKGEKFCRWDAESDEYLAELKCRRKHYNTQMIEYDKLDCVKEESDKKNKEFLYCVSTPVGIFIFNISYLCSIGYNFNWENKELPSHTDFGKCSWIKKKVGYIDVNDAMSLIHLAHTTSVPEE